MEYMTDNEKRAHDLAVAYITAVFNGNLVPSDIKIENGELSTDIFDLYENSYNMLLAKINSKFT